MNQTAPVQPVYTPFGEKVCLVPGEHMSFAISVAGITGAEATVTNKGFDVVDGVRVAKFHSTMESKGAAKLIKVVKDDVTSGINEETGHIELLDGDFLFGKKRFYVQIKRHEKHGLLVRSRMTGKMRRRHQRYPDLSRTYDSLGFMSVIRCWSPEKGTTQVAYTHAGRRLWQSKIEATGKSYVEHNGTRRQVRTFSGTSHMLTASGAVNKKKKPRNWTLHVSDDASQVPLLIQIDSPFGKVSIRLVDHIRPATAATIED